MIMKGQKRKLPPEDLEVSDSNSVSWESQRQFVFSVSLSKYQRGQELPEPSLRRSVLIANTLRQISLEACRAPSVELELSPPPCSSSSTLQTKEQESIFQGVAPAKHHSASIVANSQSAVPNCQPDSSNCAAAAISSILTALDSAIDGSQQAAPRTPLRSLENLSGVSEGGVALVKQGVRGYGGSWEQQQQQEECRVRETSMEVMRSSYLNDLTVEDLFQDIDTSLLDRDMGILGLRGSGGGYPAGDDLLRYLPPFSPPSPSSHPFSLSLNQNLKCLPSFASFSPSSFSSSSASLSSPPTSPFFGQNHMREGLELEHLMEILVEA
ncbi:hypothetical protein PAMA_020139 [Pampus argenteus]